MRTEKTDYNVDIFMHKGDNIIADGDNGNGALHSVIHEKMTKIEDGTSVTYIPFHAIDHEVIDTNKQIVDIDDDFCGESAGKAHFVGITTATINQGQDFDLTAGVKAYDANGQEIPFTVSPSSVAECTVGNQTFTYTAEGVEETREIIVTQASDPVISGLTELTVDVGEEFNPLDGVTAVDANGNSLEVTVQQA